MGDWRSGNTGSSGSNSRLAQAGRSSPLMARSPPVLAPACSPAPSLRSSTHGGSSCSLEELMARGEELEAKRKQVTIMRFIVGCCNSSRQRYWRFLRNNVFSWFLIIILTAIKSYTGQLYLTIASYDELTISSKNSKSAFAYRMLVHVSEYILYGNYNMNYRYVLLHLAGILYSEKTIYTIRFRSFFSLY